MKLSISLPRLPKALAYPDFNRLLVVRALSVFGTSMLSVAIGWRVYDLARESMGIKESALLVGLIGLVQFLPMVVLTLPAGQFVDRYDRKKILAVCVSLEFLIAGGLLLALALPPARQLDAMFAAAALFGVVRAFFPASGAAILPMVLPRSELPQGIALGSVAFQFGLIGGPAIVGFLIAWSIGGVYVLAGLAYAISVIAALRIRADTRPGPSGQSGWRMALEGFRFVTSNKVLLGAMLLDLIMVLLAGATALLPAFARDILHAGPSAVGLLRAAPAAGAVASALVLANYPLRSRLGAWLLGAAIVFGAGTLVFGLSRSLTLSCLALAVTGAADAVNIFVRQNLVQILTPNAMRGRVSAISMLFVSASNELGEFESGVAARFFGPAGAVLLGGAGAMAAGLGWGWLFPDLRKLDSPAFADPDPTSDLALRSPTN